jgi:LacI family transcriptional regulator
MLPNRKKQPTIADVAREAGMGIMTVSRVLNGHQSVSDATRKRVLAAIARMGYRPNEAARLLAGQKAKTIGLIVPDISDSFFASCCHKVQEVARSYGYLTLIVASERSQALELEEADHMASRRVAGLLIAPSGHDDRKLRSLYPPETPIVALDRPLANVEGDAVVAENRGGTELAVKHLLEHGHRNIVCVGYDENVFSIHERVESYISTMQAANLKPRYFGDIGTNEAFETLMRKLMKVKGAPTALFCLNHRTTVQALQVMKLLKVRIPQDVALIGFDDVDLGNVLNPTLTTVSQSALDLGYRGAMLLFERIRNPKMDIGFAKIILPTKLIIRESCGCTEAFSTGQ